LPSNPISASVTSSDLLRSDDDQLSENNLSTDPSDLQLIHEVITSKPLQEQEFRSIVVSDHLIDHPSEKIENQNVSDCVELIKMAILENDPQSERVIFQKN
jgi:hypothetical protein